MKRKQLDKMEDLLKEEKVDIGVLDQQARELLEETREANDEADTHINACAKLQANLEQHWSDISRWELAVEGKERELQEKEEEIDGKLERERSDLMSHVVDLNTYEAAMEAEHKRVREIHADLLNCELTISFQENTLASKEKELADKEKSMAKKQLQELTATRRKMGEL
jgi:chromosome segregation ATPase